MRDVPPALELKGVSHFHQGGRSDPLGRTIPPGQECVEIVTGGRGWVRHQGRWREVQPGDILWHSPGDATIGKTDFGDPYRCLAVVFGVGQKAGRGLPRFSFWPDLDALWALTKEACRLFLDENFARDDLRDYLDARFLFQVRLHERASRAERYPAPIRSVMNRIEKDFAQRLPIAELARTAGWSEAYLQEAFRRYVDSSPHQWLLRQRLRAAKERLISSSDPLKQIAAECGFADAAALAHTFKAHTGQTPSAYRGHYLHFYVRRKRGGKPEAA